MAKSAAAIIAFLAAMFLMTSCSRKPADVSRPPVSAAPSQNPMARTPMVYPSNPNRPPSVPSLGIPASARHKN